MRRVGCNLLKLRRTAARGVPLLEPAQRVAPSLFAADARRVPLGERGWFIVVRQPTSVALRYLVDMRQRAAQAGALFLIAKPFTADAFKDALSPVLG